MYNDLPVWTYVLITLGLTHVTIASVTIFLHRHQTHRALDLHPCISHFFRLWLWLTTGTVTKEWVAIHRKHHARVEADEDPHSPQRVGVLKVLLQGAELYRKEARNPETLEKYGFQTPDDYLERKLYSRFSVLGLFIMLAFNLACFGFIGLTIWAIQMAWIPMFAAGVINGLGHWWGYRNFESADASTNIIPLGMFIGGEELHNNHHAFASSARFSSKWYEIDLGWSYIKLMQSLGLAKVKKLAPKLAHDSAKEGVDLDTVKAVIANRLHIMSVYARDVVKQVYKEEKSKASETSKDFFKRGKRWLIRHENLMDTHAKQRLEDLLAQSHSLSVVYEYRQKLQALWQEKTASQEGLLDALQEWCQQAEQTGIKALEDFAQTMRGYSLSQV
ncbi:MAG: stearoyl-CoA desaturase (delta-9 desaturase) [Gammaproteobacteria bacterium]|jgi:stearoyl-CoA desaturase (delta-9 desaturase)